MKNRTISRKLIAILTTVALLAAFFAIGAVAAETNAPAKGYAAVGVVDAEAHKAEVLLGTGEQGTVVFEGEAPTPGAVYSYSRSGINVYTFTTPSANHGNSNQLGDMGWVFYSDKQGWLWDGMINFYYPDVKPIFFRYGNGQWAVTTIFQFEGAVGAAGMNGYALDTATNPGGGYTVGAFVFGGWVGDGSIDVTGFDVMVPSLSASAKNLGAFTQDLHEILLESGYAAVGYVDTANSLVEILKDNGEQGYVTYTGTAPVTGGVYRYGRQEGNVYTFTEPVANHGNSSLTDASKPAWYMGMSTDFEGYMWDSAPNHYWPTATTPIFLRTSLTDWMVTTEACFAMNVSVYTYQLDVTPQAPGSTYYDTQAIVFGGLNADGTIDTTGFDALTLPQTSRDLSALTNPLHPVDDTPGDIEPAPTGDASGIVSAVVAMLFAAGAVCLIAKKKD